MTNETTTTTTTPTRRRTTIAGVTAGLLGGAAVGLVLTVPSLTSAATTDDVERAVVVQDEGAEFAPDGGERPQPGDRIRTALQDLVDDGTISAAQADAVAEHLAEQVREHGPRERHRKAHAAAIVAETLGIDLETLRAELESGTTLAELADELGVDVDDVVDAVLAPVERRLDRAVETGRLSEDEAADRLEEVEDAITARVNGEQPEPAEVTDEG